MLIRHKRNNQVKTRLSRLAEDILHGGEFSMERKQATSGVVRIPMGILTVLVSRYRLIGVGFGRRFAVINGGPETTLSI
jgi:hypothetical protein